MEHKHLPPLVALKEQAKRTRLRLSQRDHLISHSASLELIAHQYGFRDWNTLCAAVSTTKAPVSAKLKLQLGQRVSGHYLGNSFEGTVISLDQRPTTGRCRVTFLFDQAVDVVRFEGLSAWRKRVSCFLGPDGRTAERTSNGTPHLQLLMPIC